MNGIKNASPLRFDVPPGTLGAQDAVHSTIPETNITYKCATGAVHTRKGMINIFDSPSLSARNFRSAGIIFKGATAQHSESRPLQFWLKGYFGSTDQSLIPWVTVGRLPNTNAVADGGSVSCTKWMIVPSGNAQHSIWNAATFVDDIFYLWPDGATDQYYDIVFGITFYNRHGSTINSGNTNEKMFGNLNIERQDW